MLILLCTAMNCSWTIEQPSGSTLEYYPCFRAMMRSLFTAGGPYAAQPLKLSIVVSNVYMYGKSHVCFCVLLLVKVTRVSFWMAHFLSKTPKRQYIYSNSSKVGILNKGRLRMGRFGIRSNTTKRTRVNGGKEKYTGTRFLQDTEILILIVSKQTCMWFHRRRNIYFEP